MNQQELKKLLPHRDSMLLLDEAEVDNGIARGRRYISGTEWFLDGHFPGNPVVPGVVLCEILAQSVCVLLQGEDMQQVTPYFTGMNNVRFKEMVRPGDTVETACEILKRKGPFVFAAGTASVQGKLCVSAEFSFALLKEKA